MKTLPNSTFRVRERYSVAALEYTTTNFIIPVSDAGGNLVRSLIKDIAINVSKSSETTASMANTRPLSVFLMDACSVAALGSEPTVNDAFDLDTNGWQVDVGYTTDGTVIYPSGISQISDLNITARDLDKTVGGTTWYLVFFGASVGVEVDVQIIGERVSITTDEYVTNFATVC